METNLIILMAFAIVVFALIARLWVLDMSHNGKKTFLVIAFMTTGIAAHAETGTTITENDSTITYNGIKIAKGADEDDSWSMHFNIGVDIATNTHGVDFAPFRSWEIGWTVAQYDWTPKNSKTTLSAGASMTFRNYTLSGHDNLFVVANNEVGVGKRDGSISELSSSIYTFGFSVPLLVKQRGSKNFAISLGAQLNYNCYGRVRNHYEQGDNEVEVSTRGIKYRPFTVDVIGIVHVAKSFGFYCKYSPMSVLKKNYGPDFKSIAVGVYF